MKATLLTALCIIFCYLSRSQEVFDVKGVPVVYLNLIDSDTITKEVKLKAGMQIKNANGSAYPEAQLFDGFVEIKGRGNSSWKLPKKPYSIDLVDKDGEDINAGLLGMPKDNEWALIANYGDKSLLRNSLAYYLGTSFHGEYSPRYRFVEVYLDSVYQGLYILCEKIKKSDDRVNIKKLTADAKDQTAPNITGGYIIEVTPRDRVEASDSFFTTSLQKKSFVLDYPKSKNVTGAQVSYIKGYVNDFEKALYGADFSDPDVGYAKYIDVNSFIDWYIVNELSRNNDARLYASCYFIKDRNGKLRAAPLWDFDIAFGNNPNNNNDQEDKFYISTAYYYKRLFEDPSFVIKVKTRWDAVKPLIDTLPVLIAMAGKQLAESGAIQRNFSKWPILGKQTGTNVAPFPLKYEGEVQRLADWVKQRNNWLNIYLNTTIQEQCKAIKTTRPVISIIGTDNYDNLLPFKVHTLKGFSKYYWNNLATASNDTVFSQPGAYWLRVVDSNGCESLLSDTLYFGSKVLAVTLTQFNVSQKDNKVNVYWSAATELNCDYYDIERASGNQPFQKQATLKARNSGRFETYNFVDGNAKDGLNIYRLKQVDKNGIASYSKNISINIQAGSKRLTMYPNPVSSALQIKYSATIQEQAHIVIIDDKGTVISTRQTVFVKGDNLITIPVSNLTSGAYLISVITKGKTVSQAFIKQDN